MNKEIILKIMLLLTIVGALLCVYLYYTDVLNAPVICPNTGCAQVASSTYSRFLGIHVSLWGLLYYFGFSLLLIFKENQIVKKFSNFLLPAFVFGGLAFTIYLRFVEVAIIKAICVWCWGSAVIVVLLLILFGLYLREKTKAKN